jgi:lysylphosphatidylglycerol synthetase-like protein (DUF2156 family)
MMRLLHRHEDEDDARDRPDEAREDEPRAPGEGTRHEVEGERYPDVYREETVDTRSTRWDIGSVLAVAAGAALAVIGAVALVRTGVNETWYEPVEQVLGMDHTPLLGAVEVGVGVLLMLAGLAGARMLAALIAVLAAAGATIVAIEPDVVDPELAMEQEWAIALAVAGFVLAAVLIVSRERRHERRTERRSLRTV